MQTLPIDLFNLPLEEISKYKNDFADTPVFFFVNPVEYHGPHLSLYNDFVLSQGLAQKIHQEMYSDKKFFIGPVIHLGVDPAKGLGSNRTSFSQLSEILLRHSRSLVKLGVKKIIFMTFHGSPLHNLAIYKAIKFLKKSEVSAINPLHYVVSELIHYHPEKYRKIFDYLEVHNSKEHDLNLKILSELNNDFHAGLFETSLCLHLAPETVGNYKKVPDCPPVKRGPLPLLLSKIFLKLGLIKISNEFKFAAFAEGWLHLNPSVGYTGWPRLADAKLGEMFINNYILPLYKEHITKILEQNAEIPKAHLSWIEWLSLKGRILGS